MRYYLSGSLKCFFAIGDGRAGGLYLCWNDLNINLNMLAHCSRFIHCEVMEKSFENHFLFNCVHAYPQKNLQPQLWNEIINLISSNDFNQSWMLLGDFNNIMNIGENVGGDRNANNHVINFNSFLND